MRDNQRPFNLYLPADLKAALDKRADELQMSTSHLIRTLAQEYVTGQQIIVRQPQAAQPAQPQES